MTSYIKAKITYSDGTTEHRAMDEETGELSEFLKQVLEA